MSEGAPHLDYCVKPSSKNQVIYLIAAYLVAIIVLTLAYLFVKTQLKGAFNRLKKKEKRSLNDGTCIDDKAPANDGGVRGKTKLFFDNLMKSKYVVEFCENAKAIPSNL